jgi:hypothetical protein
VLPALPDPLNGRVYQLQIGTFTLAKNAQDAYNRVSDTGYKPVYERNDEGYRVLIPGIHSMDVFEAARVLGSAGFTEIVIREAE